MDCDGVYVCVRVVVGVCAVGVLLILFAVLSCKVVGVVLPAAAAGVVSVSLLKLLVRLLTALLA